MSAREMTMVERVARALCEATGLRWEDQANCLTSGGGSDDEQEGYREQARAAIEAMREPTLDMEIAGTEQWLCEAAMEDRAGVNYRAMIDAALAEDRP